MAVEDACLDVMFRGHAGEHLDNPLGHVDRWRRKLRRGGLGRGFVPSVEGMKDFVRRSAPLLAPMEAQHSGSFAVSLASFEVWIDAIREPPGPFGCGPSAI